jgi:hypothetical protein
MAATSTQAGGGPKAGLSAAKAGNAQATAARAEQ